MPYLKEYLFHITDINNLDGILDQGGIWAKNKMIEKGMDTINIAYEGIQERRHRKIVPLGVGGVLHDYVPFYFAPRSPMLGAIHKGRVEGYESGQKDIIYIILKISNISTVSIPFVFTNGHSVIDYCDFSTDLNKLDSFVDWDVMRAMYWNNTEEDPDRMFRRQAEFLIHNFVPLDIIAEIAVYNNSCLEVVKLKLENHNVPISHVVKPDWYF